MVAAVAKRGRSSSSTLVEDGLKQAEPLKMRVSSQKTSKVRIWWSNGFFFIGMHLFAIYGVMYHSPFSTVDRRTLLLAYLSWQSACLGVTMGYHRYWSHRAFEATLPLRIVMAAFGSMGFQGSIKWWVLRHRLHHRFTDSPIHDPYAATKGLFYSHCGWIFLKPSYPRLKLIERDDLESDPVVVFQHRYYISIAVTMGLILPWAIAYLGWGDGMAGLVWAAVMARLGCWHATFCINSLAHWFGDRPYTEDMTARGNFFLAMVTSGEGNHNFHHAFPQDFRNGPHPADWDPTKWAIWLLHKYTPLIPKLYHTSKSDIASARARVHTAHAERFYAFVPQHERETPLEELPVWSRAEVRRRNGEVVRLVDTDEVIQDSILRYRRLLLIIDGCVVDAGRFLPSHPGGRSLMLAYAATALPLSHFDPSNLSDDSDSSDSESGPSGRSSPIIDSGYSSGGMNADEKIALRDATKAFFGGMNNHTSAAKARMRCLRVARLAEEEKGRVKEEQEEIESI